MMKFLKDRGMRKNMIRALFLIAFIIVCLSSSYYTIIGVQCLINAIAVLGLVLVSGYTRQIHLGQAAFIGGADVQGGHEFLADDSLRSPSVHAGGTASRHPYLKIAGGTVSGNGDSDFR